MVRIVDAREYRLVIPGRAVSFRSPLAIVYKRKVRRIFHQSLEIDPIEVGVECRLDYFHLHRRRFDMDNIAKCVLDALNGAAYVDDRQVSLQSARAHDLTRRIDIPGGPVDLIKPLKEHDEYLFVRIRVAD